MNPEGQNRKEEDYFKRKPLDPRSLVTGLFFLVLALFLVLGKRTSWRSVFGDRRTDREIFTGAAMQAAKPFESILSEDLLCASEGTEKAAAQTTFSENISDSVKSAVSDLLSYEPFDVSGFLNGTVFSAIDPEKIGTSKKTGLSKLMSFFEEYEEVFFSELSNGNIRITSGEVFSPDEYAYAAGKKIAFDFSEEDIAYALDICAGKALSDKELRKNFSALRSSGYHTDCSDDECFEFFIGDLTESLKNIFDSFSGSIYLTSADAVGLLESEFTDGSGKKKQIRYGMLNVGTKFAALLELSGDEIPSLSFSCHGDSEEKSGEMNGTGKLVFGDFTCAFALRNIRITQTEPLRIFGDVVVSPENPVGTSVLLSFGYDSEHELVEGFLDVSDTTGSDFSIVF